MTSPFYYPLLATWVLSFLFYGLAGGLIWTHKIRRNPHIVLTVCGFMSDFVAYFFQTQHIMMLSATVPGFALDPSLRGLQSALTNLSMGMYCLTALFGFARIVGWWSLGRWHLPVAGLFIANLIAARVIYLKLLG